MINSKLLDRLLPKNEPSKRYEVPTALGGMPFVLSEPSRLPSELLGDLDKSFLSGMVMTGTPTTTTGIDWKELRKMHADTLMHETEWAEKLHATAYEAMTRRELEGVWNGTVTPFDLSNTEMPKRPKPKPKTDKPLTQIESDWI